MKPLQDLLNQLQRIEVELLYVTQDEEQRAKARPKDPGLNLAHFDLNDYSTRSQLFVDPGPEYIPAEERFARLVSRLRTEIKAAKVYLQIDIYPYAQTMGDRLKRLESALELLEERAGKVEIPQAYYLDLPFIPDNCCEYCWECANRFIDRTRSALVFSCLLLSRQFPVLAHALWEKCDRTDWWVDPYFYGSLRPFKYWGEPEDNPRSCESCYTLLSHSLTRLGVDEECDRFLEREDDLSPEDWWQLYVVFEGAYDEDWPNYIAEKLEKLIDKYELCPRSSVMEVAK